MTISLQDFYVDVMRSIIVILIKFNASNSGVLDNVRERLACYDQVLNLILHLPESECSVNDALFGSDHAFILRELEQSIEILPNNRQRSKSRRLKDFDESEMCVMTGYAVDTGECVQSGDYVQ